MRLNLEEATAKVAELLWREANPECPISRCDAWDYCKSQARDLMQVVAPLFDEVIQAATELEQAHGLIYDLRAHVQRLTDSEDSRVVVLEAENERLRDDLGSARDWEAWENAQAEIARLKAELETAKPVLDAAQEWFAAFEYEELDKNYSAEERVLFNTIKAHPSCPSCGPGGCAGHTRKASEVETPKSWRIQVSDLETEVKTLESWVRTHRQRRDLVLREIAYFSGPGEAAELAELVREHLNLDGCESCPPGCPSCPVDPECECDVHPEAADCPACASDLDGPHAANCVVTKLKAEVEASMPSPAEVAAAHARFMERLAAEGLSSTDTTAVERG